MACRESATKLSRPPACPAGLGFWSASTSLSVSSRTWAIDFVTRLVEALQKLKQSRHRISQRFLTFSLIKWAGAAYLLYLGYTSFTSKQDSYHADTELPDQRSSRTSHFRSGFLVGISNPKAILFFTALFPQFIDPAANLFTQYLIFATTFIVFELSWLLLYAYLGASSSR